QSWSPRFRTSEVGQQPPAALGQGEHDPRAAAPGDRILPVRPRAYAPGFRTDPPSAATKNSGANSTSNRSISIVSAVGPPDAEPIGLLLTRTAKVVGRAFDEALTADGGSLPTWLVLVSLKGQEHGAQRELAEAVGIEGPTLTHHLNRM